MTQSKFPHALLVCSLALCLLLTGCEQPIDPAAPGQLAEKAGAVAAIAKGRVDIEGGVIRLAARRDGIITGVLVEEGSHVKAGQVLATLDDELARRNLDLARSEEAQAQHEQGRAELELAVASREATRAERLAKQRTVTQQELDRARDAVALAQVAFQASQAAVTTARAKYRIAERQVEECQIIAPMDGQIIQRQARPGNGVSTLNVTPLFLFTPESPRIIRAELEEQYLGEVSEGQAAEIILEADDRKTSAATVLRVGKVVGQRVPTDDPAEKQDNRVTEVVLTLKANTLLIGQRVVVRFARL